MKVLCKKDVYWEGVPGTKEGKLIGKKKKNPNLSLDLVFKKGKEYEVVPIIYNKLPTREHSIVRRYISLEAKGEDEKFHQPFLQELSATNPMFFNFEIRY